MNLLIISNNPSRASFRQRIEVYVETMRNNGIDCQVEKLPSTELARRNLFKQSANFDGVFLHKKCLNFFDAACLRKYSKKIIYDFDDAIMYSPNRPQSSRTSHYRLFSRTAKMVDSIIAGNEYLADHARMFNNNVHVLPTGLNIHRYEVQRQRKNDGRLRLVWIGSRSTLKYLEQLRTALEDIGKMYNNVVLRIIADVFFDLQNMTVEKEQWSTETEVTGLVNSDIGLAPLPDNRFTRGKCGFKILQYFSAGLPVIASPVGTNKDYITKNTTGLFATTIPQWIKQITKLIENPELRKQMAHQARIQVDKFDTSVIGQRLISIIKNLNRLALLPEVGGDLGEIKCSR